MHCVYVIFQIVLQLKIFNNENRIKRNCKFFSVDFNPIGANDIVDIHKYLMKII